MKKPGPDDYFPEVPQPPTCRALRVPFQQGKHCESDLEAGEEYFFALMMPTDANSFISMSNNKRVVAQSAAVSTNSNQPGESIPPEAFGKLSLGVPPVTSFVLTHMALQCLTPVSRV